MTGVVEQRVNLLGMYQQEARLSELHRWLTVGGSSWVIAGCAIFVPYDLVFNLMSWAALLFAPYALWRLYQVRRFGWIAAFMVLVGIPLVASLAASPMTIGGVILTSLPLIAFYIFMWSLRHAVALWQEEVRWRREDARAQAVAFVAAESIFE